MTIMRIHMKFLTNNTFTYDYNENSLNQYKLFKIWGIQIIIVF